MKLIRERPWGRVYRGERDGETVWRKHPAGATAFEVPLYALLAELVPDHILVPLEINADAGWVLLPDGGEPIGNDHLEDALVAYADVQLALAPHVDRLLAAGVTDMRPAIMPQRFDEELAALGVDGDRALVAAWAEELAASPLPASLDHNDLHGNNILAGDRFFDWGDAVVAHPLACLLVPRSVGAIGDAYLERFEHLAPKAQLRREADVAVALGQVARAHVWRRAAADDPAYRDAAAATLANMRLEPMDHRRGGGPGVA